MFLLERLYSFLKYPFDTTRQEKLNNSYHQRRDSTRNKPTTFRLIRAHYIIPPKATNNSVGVSNNTNKDKGVILRQQVENLKIQEPLQSNILEKSPLLISTSENSTTNSIDTLTEEVLLDNSETSISKGENESDTISTVANHIITDSENTQRPEQKTYSPYYYPNFSRYEYPTKVGGDNEQYTEHNWSFPNWDDEIDEFTPPIRDHYRNSHGTRGTGKDYRPDNDRQPEQDYFNQNNSSSSSNESTPTEDNDDSTIQSETEEEQKNDEQGLVLCEELSDGIDSCRRDQKSDYDRFRDHLSSLSLELRALQQEIEAAEAACLNHNWNANESSEIITDSESSIIVGSPVPSVRLIASSTTPSAIAMARNSQKSAASSPPRDNEFSPSTSPEPYFSFHGRPNNNTTTTSLDTRCSIPEDTWTSDCIREIPC
ncbi:11125_t:CDS:2 [Ambispora gerdemannii]|uniref:11125_t:CDS:1 n=1 Tax=Ambispora gerdemannii TaxID=144530 RepID=A0A9N9GEQ5_9GLOM|nr:11125_t:CDS:2 [Ambispora gerdemannii]